MKKSLEDWFAEYSESHRNPKNRLIHRVCVPLILWMVVGFFSLLRLPGAFDSPYASAAPVLCFATLIFYFSLGVKPFLQMLFLLNVCLALCALVESQVAHAWMVYAAVFVLAWIGQGIGHAFEGRKPSFFKDLQFLLIGPLWILRRH